jgi:hypothetical protein
MGIERYDPNFILAGIKIQKKLADRGKYNTYDPATPLSEDTISSMLTEEVIDYLNKEHYELDDTVQLAMFMTDGTRIPNSVILANWLEKNGYSIEDNIAVIPVTQIKTAGKGVFEKNGVWIEGQGVPSPYYPFLYDFIMSLGESLERNTIITSRNIDGIYQYTADINSKILKGDFLITAAADGLRTGNQFKTGQSTLNKWYLMIKQSIDDSTLSPNRKKETLLEISEMFNNLYNIFGYSSLNPYYREATQTLEALAMLLSNEGIITDPYVVHLKEALGYNDPSSTAWNFVDSLDSGTRRSSHKPDLIKTRLQTNIISFITDFYMREGFAGELLAQKLEILQAKIELIVNPYLSSSESYWLSEDVILGDPEYGGIREGAKRNLLSEILHAGDHQLEKLTREKLSSFLFGHPHYLNSWVSIGNIYRRVSPVVLLRMKFFVSKWQISDFESSSISLIALNRLKTEIISKIDKWILSNPYKYDSRVTRGKYYVAEHFRRLLRQYGQIDLLADFELTNKLLMAAMQRKYMEFKRDNPTGSITKVPPSLWNFHLKDLYEELGTKRNLWQSLEPVVGKPRWYSARGLESILDTLTNWHRDEFGDRAIGFAYGGRESERIPYDKNDPDVRDLLHYYQAALDSVYSYAKMRNFELNSPTISAISLSEALSKKDPENPNKIVVPRELVMDHYDIDNWESESTKAYHITYDLCRYLGIDPWTFTTLDKEIFKGGENPGGYKRHHFLALIFHKMSSHVDDSVLTSDNIHLSEYETFLREKGLEAEIYVQQLMKCLVELIEITDQNGGFVKIGINDIRNVLYKNFGEVEGEIILDRWMNGDHQSDFGKTLDEFNDRRQYAFNKEYENFLSEKYDTAYSAYFFKVRGLTLTKILATRNNVEFLNIIYRGRYTFTLKPIPRPIKI